MATLSPVVNAGAVAENLQQLPNNMHCPLVQIFETVADAASDI